MRRLQAAIAAVAIAATLQGAQATPTLPPLAPPTAGILASPNVSLILNIPDVVAVGGRFASHYFFTTAVAGLRIYDVTNPEMPVLTGTLPIPHWENEDVDVSTSRKLVLISRDSISKDYLGGALYVISWENPMVPKLLATLDYPKTVQSGTTVVGGPGHIANCIADCARYAYVIGARNGSTFVIDLKDPAAPKISTTIPASMNSSGKPNGVFKTGVVHNIDIDKWGYAWSVGSGGTTQLDVRNPLKPKALRWVSPKENNKTNHFIHHNSLRLSKDTLLVTEEDYPEMCGHGPNGGHEGTFQTWKINNAKTGSGAIAFQDQWHTELGQYVDGGAAATVSCSSHWFTYNKNKVVAVGWYDQGVRFLDVSNPKHIRQVGYWVRPTLGLGASAGLFVPGRPDLAYVADYNRGLDILKIEAGGLGAKTVEAPVRREWFTLPGEKADPFRFAQPHPVWGWACLLPKAEDIVSLAP